MVASVSRRGAIALAAVFAVAGRASFADSAGATVAAMAEYLGAAVRLFAGTQSRVESVELSQLSQDAKSALRGDMAELVGALDRLLPRPGLFVGDLRGYLERAAANGFDSAEQRESAWDAIRQDVQVIYDAVGDVLRIVTRPRSRLDVVISDADRLQLQSVLVQRGAILERFGRTPSPATPGELSALKILTDRFDLLRQAVERFHASLRAKQRAIET